MWGCYSQTVLQGGKREQASQWKESRLGSSAVGFAGAKPYPLPGSEIKVIFKLCPRILSEIGHTILIYRSKQSFQLLLHSLSNPRSC